MKILYLPNQYSQQRQREKPRFIYPVLLAMQAEYYRQQGHEVYWEPWLELTDTIKVSFEKIIREPEDIDFLKLPAPDRLWTDAKNKIYQGNGNFKYHPGTYIQVANGCWHGKCSFCVEQKNKWQVRPVESVIQELEEIKRLGFRECFDDSGTFPVGTWLNELLSRPKPNLVLGCNMRMVDAPWERMMDWGFRMVLFGLESANQPTLDRINKGTKVEDIKYIIESEKAGLEPHVSAMVGFSWETEKEAINTVNLLKWLLKKGYAKTAQMSFYEPPDGMTRGNESQRKFVDKHYSVAFSPLFWYNKITSIKSMDDFDYIIREIKEGLKHYAKTDHLH